MVVSRLTRVGHRNKRLWIRVLDRLVLGINDQQLVTGISILLIELSRVCPISTCHFYLTNILAMFSCSSHLTSVCLCLLFYLQARWAWLGSHLYL